MQIKGITRIADRDYEDACESKIRLGISESTLRKSVLERGMPAPLCVGKRRFFDLLLVDQWMLTQVRVPECCPRATAQAD
jgi:hypothetical protein